MKPAICIPCHIVPFDRQGNEVERGDPRALSWGYPDRTLPKHRGKCSAVWPGIGKSEPQDAPRAAGEEVTLDDLVRDATLQEARDEFAVMRPGPPAPRISPITGRDSVGEIAAFHYATCDCGCGQTFDRCKTRTPDEAFRAAKAQYAAKRNGKPVAPRKSVPSTRTEVKAKTRGRGRNAR